MCGHLQFPTLCVQLRWLHAAEQISQLRWVTQKDGPGFVRSVVRASPANFGCTSPEPQYMWIPRYVHPPDMHQMTVEILKRGRSRQDPTCNSAKTPEATSAIISPNSKRGSEERTDSCQPTLLTRASHHARQGLAMPATASSATKSSPASA